jgi:hypothetical protein
MPRLRKDISNHNHHKWRSSYERRLTIFCLLAFNTVLVIHVSDRGQYSNTRKIVTGSVLSHHGPSSSSLGFGPTSAHRQLCPGTTDYFDIQELHSSIDKAITFHNHGGNIQAVQALLNDNIDVTVQKLGAKFVPTAAAKKHKGEIATGTHNVTQYLQEYYAKHPDPRGGYGQPLPGKYDKVDPLIIEGRYVEVAEPSGRTRERWDASVGPIGPTCQNLLQLGKTNRDGTKWYCQSSTQQPQLNIKESQHVRRQLQEQSTIRRKTAWIKKAKQMPPPSNPPPAKERKDDSHSNNDIHYQDCHIISIGGNDNWKFESQVVQKMKGCTTHTFDCTLPDGTPKRKPDRKDILFYNYCMDSHRHHDDFGREYVTYFDMLQIANLQAPPVLLKIDVEGFEYDIFSHMIQQANNGNSSVVSLQQQQSSLSWWLPQQIQVELHWATRMTGVSWMPRTKTTAEIALLCGMMFNGGGYLPIHQYWHPACPCCMEVLYFRALCSSSSTE